MPRHVGGPFAERDLDSTPGTNDWNTDSNWTTPATVPTGTAIFDLSNTTAIQFAPLSTTAVGTLHFDPGAPDYTFSLLDNTLTINAAGIVNDSANSPTFSVISAIAAVPAPPPARPTASAELNFLGASTAGNATIIVNDNVSPPERELALLQFFNNSTAGTANVTNNFNGQTEFWDTSTAGNATFTNNAQGITRFSNDSTAGNSTITNNVSGLTDFCDTSTAGNSTIITNLGGFTDFEDKSTGGNATIITNPRGTTTFLSNSTAGNATVTTNSQGSTVFVDTSTGGNGRFITNAGGIVDISGLTSSGMTAGSIEGAGTYVLGSKVLTVGLNNLNTEVSGLITDGSGAAGGALIKVGTGTLTLTGPNNNYSGGTSFNGGILAVNSDTNLGTGALSFDGGTLQALASGPGIISAKAIMLNAGGGTFLANAGTTSTLSGAITGAGAFTKSGPGLLELSGNNSYLGTTTINAGTLRAGSITALSLNSAFTVNSLLDLNGFSNTVGSLAGSGTVTNNGGSPAILTAGGNGTNTVFGGILTDGTGVLGFTKTGAGVMILTGANNYAGGTTISAGTLQLGDGSATGSITGAVVNQSIFNLFNANTGGITTITNTGSTNFFNTSTAGTATIITNPGGLTEFLDSSTGGQARLITNAGGAVDISGLTSGGMTAGSIEGAGTYFLGSKALTVGGNNLSTEVTGTIGGTGGALIKIGTGTLTLSGPNTYSGGTTLNAGALTVNNAQALGLGDVTVNGGVLRSNRQPINVGGNYTQNGGTLQLQVAGPNPGQYDSLNVGGNARLGGTLQLLDLGFKPQGGNQLTLVTTGGVVSGQFGQFVNPYTSGPGFTSVELIYGLDSVLLRFLNSGPPVVTTIDFSSFALTRNQRAAAGLLDAVQTDTRAANLISFFQKEPFANFPADFDKISPDSLTAFYEITFSNANIQRLNMEGRMDDIHYGSNGFNSNMKVNEPPSNPEGKYVVDGKSSKEVVDGKSSKSVVEPVLQRGPQNRWGVWVTGFGDFVNVDSDGNGRGYDFTTGGVSLGIDYRITEHLAIGIMGEYSHTWTSLQPNGNIDVNSGARRAVRYMV